VMYLLSGGISLPEGYLCSFYHLHAKSGFNLLKFPEFFKTLCHVCVFQSKVPGDYRGKSPLFLGSWNKWGLCYNGWILCPNGFTPGFGPSPGLYFLKPEMEGEMANRRLSMRKISTRRGFPTGHSQELQHVPQDG